MWLLSIVFVVLKLTKVIRWSWWIVFLPCIFDIVVGIMFAETLCSLVGI